MKRISFLFSFLHHRLLHFLWCVRKSDRTGLPSINSFDFFFWILFFLLQSWVRKGKAEAERLKRLPWPLPSRQLEQFSWPQSPCTSDDYCAIVQSSQGSPHSLKQFTCSIRRQQWWWRWSCLIGVSVRTFDLLATQFETIWHVILSTVLEFFHCYPNVALRVAHGVPSCTCQRESWPFYITVITVVPTVTSNFIFVDKKHKNSFSHIFIYWKNIILSNTRISQILMPLLEELPSTELRRCQRCSQEKENIEGRYVHLLNFISLL